MASARRGRWALCAALLAAACGPAAGPAYEAPTPRAYPTRRLILPSGLEIVVDQDDTLPAIGVVWTVRAGAVQDPPDRAGLAHAVEHLAFRASDAKGVSLLDRLYRLGAVDVNAVTSHDDTTYHAFIHREAARDLLALEIASLAAPLANVTEAVFAQEMGIVREELAYRDLGGGSQLAHEALFKSVFPAKHPYTRPVGGTRASWTGRHRTSTARRRICARASRAPNTAPAPSSCARSGTATLTGPRARSRTSGASRRRTSRPGCGACATRATGR